MQITKIQNTKCQYPFCHRDFGISSISISHFGNAESTNSHSTIQLFSLTHTVAHHRHALTHPLTHPLTVTHSHSLTVTHSLTHFVRVRVCVGWLVLSVSVWEQLGTWGQRGCGDPGVKCKLSTEYYGLRTYFKNEKWILCEQ